MAFSTGNSKGIFRARTFEAVARMERAVAGLVARYRINGAPHDRRPEFGEYFSQLCEL